ncbi:COQ9 family protein [Insolitispirillum peregrinum]|uniref:Ubiquinone biosynthesis protein COQ9 n=1 Tax=Insolitispirillum peregrinum TaxID=80876 RepID=A0A1N7NRQ4_9PROT|nr:COQ9 family protein [Insolitispirillum peregrinum]SIT00929.1 ubiquinone biosynthesis protein COQ9 [Insolitispirillum peregrinum]
MSNEESLDALRERLVLAALEHVPFDGWSTKALRHACQDLGLDSSAAERLFPHGVTTAVECFTVLADRLMAEDVAALPLAEMNVRDRIIAVVKARLTRWAPHQESIRRALAVYAMPATVAGGAKATWNTADAMWKAIGDRSADFSWYTKRATLSAVYSATLLYWLDDQSEDFAETWLFLERRVEDVVKAIRLRQTVGTSVGKALSLLPNPLAFIPRPGSGLGARRSGGRRNGL